MLKHSYDDIAKDHTRTQLETGEQAISAGNLLRGIVHDVCKEVSFGKVPTYPAVG